MLRRQLFNLPPSARHAEATVKRLIGTTPLWFAKAKRSPKRASVALVASAAASGNPAHSAELSKAQDDVSNLLIEEMARRQLDPAKAPKLSKLLPKKVARKRRTAKAVPAIVTGLVGGGGPASAALYAPATEVNVVEDVSGSTGRHKKPPAVSKPKAVTDPVFSLAKLIDDFGERGSGDALHEFSSSRTLDSQSWEEAIRQIDEALRDKDDGGEQRNHTLLSHLPKLCTTFASRESVVGYQRVVALIASGVAKAMQTVAASGGGWSVERIARLVSLLFELFLRLPPVPQRAVWKGNIIRPLSVSLQRDKALIQERLIDVTAFLTQLVEADVPRASAVDKVTSLFVATTYFEMLSSIDVAGHTSESASQWTRTSFQKLQSAIQQLLSSERVAALPVVAESEASVIRCLEVAGSSLTSWSQSNKTALRTLVADAYAVLCHTARQGGHQRLIDTVLSTSVLRAMQALRVEAPQAYHDMSRAMLTVAFQIAEREANHERRSDVLRRLVFHLLDADVPPSVLLSSQFCVGMPPAQILQVLGVRRKSSSQIVHETALMLIPEILVKTLLSSIEGRVADIRRKSAEEGSDVTLLKEELHLLACDCIKLIVEFALRGMKKEVAAASQSLVLIANIADKFPHVASTFTAELLTQQLVALLDGVVEAAKSTALPPNVNECISVTWTLLLPKIADALGGTPGGSSTASLDSATTLPTLATIVAHTCCFAENSPSAAQLSKWMSGVLAKLDKLCELDVLRALVDSFERAVPIFVRSLPGPRRSAVVSMFHDVVHDILAADRSWFAFSGPWTESWHSLSPWIAAMTVLSASEVAIESEDSLLLSFRTEVLTKAVTNLLETQREMWSVDTLHTAARLFYVRKSVHLLPLEFDTAFTDRFCTSVLLQQRQVQSLVRSPAEAAAEAASVTNKSAQVLSWSTAMLHEGGEVAVKNWTRRVHALFGQSLLTSMEAPLLNIESGGTADVDSRRRGSEKAQETGKKTKKKASKLVMDTPPPVESGIGFRAAVGIIRSVGEIPSHLTVMQPLVRRCVIPSMACSVDEAELVDLVDALKVLVQAGLAGEQFVSVLLGMVVERVHSLTLGDCGDVAGMVTTLSRHGHIIADTLPNVLAERVHQQRLSCKPSEVAKVVFGFSTIASPAPSSTFVSQATGAAARPATDLRTQVLMSMTLRTMQVAGGMTAEELLNTLEGYLAIRCTHMSLMGVILAKISDSKDTFSLPQTVRLVSVCLEAATYDPRISKACTVAAQPVFLARTQHMLKNDVLALVGTSNHAELILNCLCTRFPKDPIADDVLRAVAQNCRHVPPDGIIAALNLIATSGSADFNAANTLFQHCLEHVVAQGPPAQTAGAFLHLVRCGVRTRQFYQTMDKRLGQLVGQCDNASLRVMCEAALLSRREHHWTVLQDLICAHYAAPGGDDEAQGHDLFGALRPADVRLALLVLLSGSVTANIARLRPTITALVRRVPAVTQGGGHCGSDTADTLESLRADEGWNWIEHLVKLIPFASSITPTAVASVAPSARVDSFFSQTDIATAVATVLLAMMPSLSKITGHEASNGDVGKAVDLLLATAKLRIVDHPALLPLLQCAQKQSDVIRRRHVLMIKVGEAVEIWSRGEVRSRLETESLAEVKASIQELSDWYRLNSDSSGAESHSATATAHDDAAADLSM